MTRPQLNPKNMTHSALERFAALVDMAMEADQIDTTDRITLIGDHAYDFANPKAIKDMKAGIKRCQGYGRVYTSGHTGNQYGAMRS